MSALFCSTFLPLRRVAACALVAAVAGACVPAALARSAAAAPPSLHPGDSVVITGTKLNCVVSIASEATTQPTTLVCGEGPTGAPSPGTYAFAIADGGALLLKSSAKGKPELAAHETEPSTLPGTFPAGTSRKPRAFKVAVGKDFDVAGTDVYCGATSDGGVAAITCGLAYPKTTFLVGSVVALVSSKAALLSKLVAKGKFESLKAAAQPAA
jgi:hypothetical protein